MSEAAAVEAPPAGVPATPQPFADAFSDLENFATPPGEEGLPKSSKKADEGPPVDKGEVEAPPETPPKPEEKTHDKTPQDDKPKQEEKGKPPGKPPSRIVELSKAYEGLKAKHRQLEQDLVAKNAELEAIRTKPPAEDPEKKTLQERLSEREKRLQDLENEIRFHRYESSQEYKDKYEQPFINAFQTGRQKTSSLKVVERKNDETGEIIQQSRQATANDFDRIAMIGDDDQAAEVAEQLFGSRAPMVLYHRERVQELNAAKEKAVQDFRKVGSEREKQLAEKSQQERKRMVEMFDAITKQSVEKFPALFKPVEGDEKGNELLKKGFDLVDTVFKGDTSRIPPEKLVAMHAAVRNRAAAFGRLAYQNKGLQEKITELEKELDQYRESEPAGGEADGKGKSKTVSESWEDALDKLARPPG